MIHFTVFGASGFIGSHLTTHVRNRGLICVAAPRRFDIAANDLGIVLYAIGVTSDFRERPLDAVDAHVGRLMEVIRNGRYESIVYLSSTRLYRNSASTREDASLSVHTNELDDVYNISKAMGESMVLNTARNGKVVRLSNVYGGDVESRNFLTAVIREAVTQGRILLRTSPESAKDYISIAEVCDLIFQIATEGSERIYNIASGRPTSHADIVGSLQRVTGCSMDVAPGAPLINGMPIDVARVRNEFGFEAERLIDHLPEIVDQFRAAVGTA